MRVIIGGVERKVQQVKSYAEYMGGKEKLKMKNAEEIFYESRANKLFDKVIQLKMDEVALAVAKGANVALEPITKPPINSFDGDTAYDKAVNAEIFYAEEAARHISSAREWKFTF